MKKRAVSAIVAAGLAFTAAAQSAFVCQYDGMNETNRIEVKTVKASGANRTLTWTADRDYAQCGAGFEFVAAEDERRRAFAIKEDGLYVYGSFVLFVK